MSRLLLIVPAFMLNACTLAATPSAPGAPVLREVTAKSMPVVCLDAEHVGKPVSGCPFSRQRFSSATESSLVRTCPDPTGTGKCPDVNAVRWKRFADVIAGTVGPDLVEVCSVEKQEGDVVSGGSCKSSSSGSTWSGMVYVKKESVSHVPPLPPATFTISPTSGVSPVDVALAWNVPGMTGDYPCTATGDWEGQKAAASTEVIQSVMKDAAYTLTCTHIPAGGAVASWTKSTTNTDGTPLTNPAGYLLSFGNSTLEGGPVLSSSVNVPYSQTSYLFADLLPMRWYFGIQTLANAPDGSGATKSALSNIATYEVKPRTQQIQRFTATVNVTVTQVPSPPGAFTVSAPQAYKLNEDPNSLTIEEVGVVPVGTPCDDKQPVLGKFVIRRESITPAPGQTLPDVVVAECVQGTWQPAPTPHKP